MSTFHNMAIVRYFEVTCDKFHVVEICYTGNYAQMWVNKLCNYSFKVLAGLTKWNETFDGK